MAELLETKRYQFDFNGGEHVILAQVIFMKDSMYLYITSSDSDSCMMNMSAAMNTRFDTMPIVSHLISSENITADSWGTSIAQKVSLLAFFLYESSFLFYLGNSLF